MWYQDRVQIIGKSPEKKQGGDEYKSKPVLTVR